MQGLKNRERHLFNGSEFDKWNTNQWRRTEENEKRRLMAEDIIEFAGVRYMFC